MAVRDSNEVLSVQSLPSNMLQCNARQSTAFEKATLDLVQIAAHVADPGINVGNYRSPL